jgi:type I restriction enzyme S subunit
MNTATTHIDNKPSLQASHCEDKGRSKRKQSDPLVPLIRFKEFDWEWTKKDFGSIVEKAKAKHDPQKSKDEYPCIEMESIAKESSILLEVFNSKNQLSIKNKFSKGEVLFGKLRPNLKKYVIAPFDGVCSSEIWVLKGKELSNEFLFRLIQTNKFYSSTLVTSGSKMPRADWAYISSSIFPYPSLPEQQKIASFLSAVDKKIQQLTKKKALLEDYKKGVMQQLFSGQLRFKDENGKAYPDWEEKRLGEIATKASSNIAANTIEENVGEYKLYGASGFLKKIDFFREKEPFISIVKDGAGVGRTLLCDANSSVLGTLDIIKPKVKVVLYFLYLVLNNVRFEKYMVGSTIPHIYYKDYSNEKITIPCIEEQQKIASYLSGIDTKIGALNNQITQNQIFKKGLLQQMFV